ncbi:MAG: PepSY domain-containing protein [Chitinophagaceae bacterium]|jgi:hypothetical protein|nr:PepSY domain-containing protein [Chitinophagaceae bacterium]
MNTTMRIWHRYLGFFLAGIMTVYALSGIVMIFRQTDFLKKEKAYERSLQPNMPIPELGREIGIRDLKIDKEEGALLTFKQGTYNKETGLVKYTTKELPYILNKMTKMHKATTKDPFFYLNIFFGLSLLFFVISSFWMFMPGTKIFRKGLYFTLAGLALAFLLIFV